MATLHGVTELGFDRYYAELDAETAKLADAVLAADPTHPVPTCPEWTIADLVAHVGRGIAWAATIIEQRALHWIPIEQVIDSPIPGASGGSGAAGASGRPGTREERAAWLRAGASRLADAVRDAGPDTHVWTWSDDRTAGFWLARLTHETVIHRVDAELAIGRQVSLAADLAADGVRDLLSSISVLSADGPDPMFAGLRGDGETLHFHATDDGLGAAGEWFVTRPPARVTWEHGHRKADVAVRGPALQLLLVLTRRASLDGSDLAVHGDERLFAHWLEHSAF